MFAPMSSKVRGYRERRRTTAVQHDQNRVEYDLYIRPLSGPILNRKVADKLSKKKAQRQQNRHSTSDSGFGLRDSRCSNSGPALMLP